MIEYGILVAALSLALAVGYRNVSGGINFLFEDNASKMREIYPNAQ